MVQGGYGSRSVLSSLAAEAGLDVQPLVRLTRQAIDKCQVLILPQPRVSASFTPQQASMVADWVARGGGLIATHDAVGYRGIPPVIPEVCAGGVNRVRDGQWIAVAEHPVTAGIPISEPRPHSYYDHIELEPGAQGTVVATGAATPVPVVVCGTSGEGRYVACGIAIGPRSGRCGHHTGRR